MKSISAWRSAFLVSAITLAFAAAILTIQPSPVSAQDDEKVYPPHVEVESSNPYSGNQEAIDAGATLYFKFCVSCHGVRADGVSRFGEYAGNLTKFWRGYGEFIAIVSAGRPPKGMPPWGQYLDAQQMSQIGAFLETLSIEGARWK